MAIEILMTERVAEALRCQCSTCAGVLSNARKTGTKWAAGEGREIGRRFAVRLHHKRFTAVFEKLSGQLVSTTMIGAVQCATRSWLDGSLSEPDSTLARERPTPSIKLRGPPTGTAGATDRGLAHHRRIVECIRGADSAGARRVMNEHMDEAFRSGALGDNYSSLA